jgi:hypothetical protein
MQMEFMLETICDIKNNKKRPKEDPSHHTRIKKWLQKVCTRELHHPTLKRRLFLFIEYIVPFLLACS